MLSTARRVAYALTVLASVLAVPAWSTTTGWTPIRLGGTLGKAFPSVNAAPNVYGLDLGFPSAVSEKVAGVQWGLWFTNSAEMDGLRIGAINNLLPYDSRVRGVSLGLFSDDAQMAGVEVGVVNFANLVAGAQLGLLNLANGAGLQAGVYNRAYSDYTGLSLGLANNAPSFRGVQIGILNQVEDGAGMQIGLVNSASRRYAGLQLGLVNWIADKKGLPVMLGANARF